MGKVGGGCTLECASIQTQDTCQKKGEKKVANLTWIAFGYMVA
jgi:hypothetical protein